jgi:LacI family transcriptional regulator
MRHVAALAGVGVKTVSRVINGEPNVSAATIAKVNAAARTLDYQPDLHAGNLRRADGRTRTLGLLVGSVDNPFAGAVHRAVEDVALARGVAVFASSLDDDPDREQEAVAAFLRRRVDGLILTTVSESQAYLAPELRRGTPVVFVDREPAGITSDAVVSDNADGAAVATRHLLEHGHRNVAYLGDRPVIQTARERRRGFLEELGRAGVATRDVPVIEGLHDEETARTATLALFDSPNPPTALFSSQNLVTIGVIHALRELGRHRDTALVGFDDVPLAISSSPASRSSPRTRSASGREAAERVFARLDGDHTPRGAYDRADPTDRARLRRDPAAQGRLTHDERDSIAETRHGGRRCAHRRSCATSTAPGSSSAARRSTWPWDSRSSTRTSRSSRCSATTKPASRIRAYLRDYGVRLVESPSAHGTSRAVSDRTDGEPRYEFNEAAKRRGIRFDDATRGALDEADLVVVSCFPFDDAAQYHALVDAIDRPRERLVVDGNPRPECSPIARRSSPTSRTSPRGRCW